MIKKVNILIYSIILLFCIQNIINYSYIFYNKKHKINFSLEKFKEDSLTIDNNKITYHKFNINYNESYPLKNIFFIHNIYESSFSFHKKVFPYIQNGKSLGYNLNITFIDLPKYEKSHKNKYYDYSFRNLSNILTEFLISLNENEVILICDGISCNLALNMCMINDQLISKVILLNPKFSYNSHLELLSWNIKNNINLITSFIKLIKNNTLEEQNEYKSCYSNLKNSSNKYFKKILKSNNEINLNEINTQIPIYTLIHNKNSINKHISQNNWLYTIIYNNPSTLNDILKNRLIN